MLLTDLPSQNAIKFGNLFYKPNQIEEIISKSCRMVFLEAKDEGIPLGRTGSSTLIKFRKKYFILMTRHELGIKPNKKPTKEILETIRVESSTDVLGNIPLSRCVFESSNPEEEYHDLLFFEASPLSNNKRDTPYFMLAETFSKKQRLLSYVIGCPIENDVMSNYLDSFYEDDNKPIHIKKTIANCSYDESFVSEIDNFKRYIDGPDGDLNGFSGGPVISLVEGDNGYEMVFDGIVVRGGESQIYIVDTNYIELALKKDG